MYKFYKLYNFQRLVAQKVFLSHIHLERALHRCMTFLKSFFSFSALGCLYGTSPLNGSIMS